MLPSSHSPCSIRDAARSPDTTRWPYRGKLAKADDWGCDNYAECYACTCPEPAAAPLDWSWPRTASARLWAGRGGRKREAEGRSRRDRKGSSEVVRRRAGVQRAHEAACCCRPADQGPHPTSLISDRDKAASVHEGFADVSQPASQPCLAFNKAAARLSGTEMMGDGCDGAAGPAGLAQWRPSVLGLGLWRRRR
ncbi:hypothetical protein CDD83_8627 [Cordyceps sp. RAO-2017]|nr:hypothetical protein CDD83_8627 [Cordyceps sp. RAO-2017]